LNGKDIVAPFLFMKFVLFIMPPPSAPLALAGAQSRPAKGAVPREGKRDENGSDPP
jgi:hypothetical protein